MFGGYSKRNVLPVFQVFDDKLSGGKLTEVQDCEDGTFTIKIEFPVTESNKSIAMEKVDQEVWQFPADDDELVIDIKFVSFFIPHKKEIVDFVLSDFNNVDGLPEVLKLKFPMLFKMWLNVIVDRR